jgi:Kef-type K+ transport system membrane component KefB
MTFEVGGVHCGFSLLLVCMMTGTIFCNICSTSEELMERVDNWVMPLNVLFFVISGAELDLEILSHPVTIIVGIIYILSRSAGKYYGAAISCKLTKQPKPITDNLGITLLPQAGVALGMALTAATLPDGALARNVVLFAVLVYELIGPALTKRSLLAVGEIRPEGRTSARRHNTPKTHK